MQHNPWLRHPKEQNDNRPNNQPRTNRLAGRRWLRSPACHSQDITSSDFKFRIASYNVLAQCYAKNKHFTRSKAEHLRWDVRRRALVEVIHELDADIVCLQEVDNYEKFWLKEMRKLGYTGCYKQRNSPAKFDGCATFFRSTAFECMSVSSIEFDSEPDAGGGQQVEGHPDFATHNVALLTMLRPRRSSNVNKCCMCLANAHLFWDPTYEELKIAQARALVKAAEELSTSSESKSSIGWIPIILAGDFNSTPESEVYRYLTREAGFSSSYVACGLEWKQMETISLSNTQFSQSQFEFKTPEKKNPKGEVQLQSAESSSPELAAKSGECNAGIANGGLLFAKPLDPNSPVFKPSSPSMYKADSRQRSNGDSAGGKEARPAGTAPGIEPAFTNYRDMFHGTIDYILFRAIPTPKRPPSHSGNIQAVSCLSMISELEAQNQGGGLPNLKHPSDHLPIAVELMIQFP
ncbi:hypothetical protein GUITHDRAFT_85586 [Guillardia theta CCMP2712]|uniref:Endonuclease/exonuclease/phosphatase domain-containing protein n=1 Tax=Guillardia theta (strain CCMP2712) TaxID=905079 RepID=L1JP28_GUITC|nr:hypothetical protein GUITHDRAFT_85586 [Guillardia theta CCMP2712]EKX50049.1 hypothetical protein GUITHDRAFT_85586 [Guillardia theta CCMP2712]|eukprot:XP_005837029.1 hypothetical protein GUITHDRAFT_85586 [Guillardia theta CCMP2712]